MCVQFIVEEKYIKAWRKCKSIVCKCEVQWLKKNSSQFEKEQEEEEKAIAGLRIPRKTADCEKHWKINAEK